METKLREWVDDVKTWGEIAMPEIYSDYQEFVATGQYPYLSAVEDFIISKRKLPEDLRTKVHTQCYIASHQARNEAKNKQEAGFTVDGYTKITLENYEQIPVGKAEIIKIGENILGGKVVTKTPGKFVDWAFLPKGNRTRGYKREHLIGAFYKLI